MLHTPTLAALASPRRREILRLVWDEERSAGEIREAMPDVTFGAVSLQLKALERAGLVECRREKQFRYYRAVRESLAPVAAALEHMWNDALWTLKLAAELEESRRGPRPARRRRGKPAGTTETTTGAARQKQLPHASQQTNSKRLTKKRTRR